MLTERAQDHVARPRNRGEMERPDAFGVAGEPGSGPYVQIWLRLNGDVVVAATYEPNGCPSSIACASQVCELATGRDKKKLAGLAPEDLIAVLGGLPEGKESYASLAIQALRSALEKSHALR